MFSNLRNRLLASYLFLLLISLSVLAIVLVIILSSRQAPPQITWGRLEALLPTLLSVDNLRNAQQSYGINNRLMIFDSMDQFSETNDVRVLLLAINGNQNRIIYDTANLLNRDDFLALRRQPYQPTRVRTANANINLVFGDFTDGNETVWLFGGAVVNSLGGRLLPDAWALLISEEQPNESLQSVLSQYGSSVILMLIQAGCVGGLVALGLAFWISRSIARPLQSLAESAQSVASGDYHQLVAEEGPQEFRDVAQAFNHMMGEVHQAQQSQRDFVVNVSHDLKTPLTSIQGFSQAIIDGAAKNPAYAAQIIHDEAERLNRMVTELTDLHRLQAGRLSMKMSAIDVGEVATAIVQRLQVVAQQKAIQLTLQRQTLPYIAGDGDRLVQVFTNIISNAIKYTPDSGMIWVSTGVQGGGVVVIVRDSGIGISAEDLPRIFERFYQADKSRGPQRGTGLGLAITQEIVQAHGGRITIDSAGENQGTTVTVWFPSPNLTTIVNRR